VRGDDPFANEAPLGPAAGCLIHSLAYEYATELLPVMLGVGTRRRRQVWDALFTGDMLQEGMSANCSAGPPAGQQRPAAHNFPVPRGAPAFYVDYHAGSDAAAGTEAFPVKTVQAGLRLARGAPGRAPGSPVHVVLRAGIHHLGEPLALGPADAGLVLQNYPAEEAWLSGAQPVAPAWEPWSPPFPAPPGSSCPTVCAAMGHCCVGDVSSWLSPSCAMGCTMATLTKDNAACLATCDAANGKASFKLGNHTFNMAGTCPSGCSASDGVTECYQGCKIQNKVPLGNTARARLGLGANRTVWGLHLLEDEDPWHTVMPRARYPNKAPNAGSREYRWAQTGPNATWTSMQPVHDLGHQITINATALVPKSTTVFPDYYVYGVGGACAKAGYDPPGGYLCSTHGGMHGGEWDEKTMAWSCPGCTDGYPAVFPSQLKLVNTTGARQKTFPNAHLWPADISGAVLHTWVNGWFTEMWELDSFDPATGVLALGKGGFHGGQPHMLDSVLPDGSPGQGKERYCSVFRVGISP